MKRTTRWLALILVCVLALACLTGCGASSGASYDAKNSASGGKWSREETAPASPEPEESYFGDDSAYDSAASAEASTSIADSAAGVVNGIPTGDLAEKLIFSASAEIETLDFDKSVADIYEMLDRYGAFLESSYTGGSSYRAQYYGYTDYRTANFVIRVPRDRFTDLTGALDTIGNVTSMNTSVENITPQYTDVNARLQTYRTEEERLLSMLEKAETVEDMITIEDRLSFVRYNIESLTATLRNWDNEVDYCSVTVYLQEVEELRTVTAPQRTYGEKLRDGLAETLAAIGRFFSGFFLWLVSALPVLIILAVVAVIVILLVRRGIRRSRKRKAARFDPVSGAPLDGDNKAE